MYCLKFLNYSLFLYILVSYNLNWFAIDKPYRAIDTTTICRIKAWKKDLLRNLLSANPTKR